MENSSAQIVGKHFENPVAEYVSCFYMFFRQVKTLKLTLNYQTFVKSHSNKPFEKTKHTFNIPTKHKGRFWHWWQTNQIFSSTQKTLYSIVVFAWSVGKLMTTF